MARDETMAIIRGPKFGVGDRGRTTLTFNAYVSENSAALQVFSAEDAAEILETYGVDDVAKLDGKPCWVNATPGMIVWARPLVFS